MTSPPLSDLFYFYRHPRNSFYPCFCRNSDGDMAYSLRNAL